MATPVIMPRQGQSVESCILTEWYKKPGDNVNKGDLLFAYETDKASFEEEAPKNGILLAVLFEEGDEIPVLTNVAVIGQEGEAIDEYTSSEQTATSIKEVTEISVSKKEETKNTKEVDNAEVTVSSTDKTKISPRAKNLANKLGVQYNNTNPTGPKGRIIERDIQKQAEEAPRMTPLAKEIAKKENLVAETSSGLGGRTASFDLMPFEKSYTNDFEDKKVSNIRKIIAKNMHSSLQNSAQLTHHTSADARKMLAYRVRIKKKMNEGTISNITLNDMVCFAVIKALKNLPEINVHFSGDVIRQFNKVHLGIAVDTPRGLMVPALKNADDLSIGGLSTQLKELAENCKKGNIDPELLSSQAASFTVSNLGSFGVEMFTPVINLPQAGILGVNTIIKRPADIGGGVVGFVPFIGLSLTYDHRVLDGAPASAFLREVKLQIENLDLNI